MAEESRGKPVGPEERTQEMVGQTAREFQEAVGLAYNVKALGDWGIVSIFFDPEKDIRIDTLRVPPSAFDESTRYQILAQRIGIRLEDLDVNGDGLRLTLQESNLDSEDGGRTFTVEFCGHRRNVALFVDASGIPRNIIIDGETKKMDEQEFQGFRDGVLGLFKQAADFTKSKLG